MNDAQTHPYADAAQTYWQAGWRGILPLPVKRKANPPVGWTGRTGGWPSQADLAAWCSGPEGDGNLGLRLPPGVLGIDVDNYSGKRGKTSLAEAEAKWGPLPATWISTSRSDGSSGIRLYLVPEGLAWPGEVGDGIETVHVSHRYVVSWPSLHPEGRTYRWISPSGHDAIGQNVPRPDDLPELPESWIIGLTNGAADVDQPKADLDDLAASAWLLRHGAGDPCPAVRSTVDRYVSQRLVGASSRHDAARDATARLLHMAADGHLGVVKAVNEVAVAFRAAVDPDDRRPADQGEWKRLYLGAVRLAAVDTAPEPPPDPCLPTDLFGQPILDISTVTVEDAQAQAMARALQAEIAMQRLRRDARKALEDEEHEKAFRVPPSTPTLFDELAIPDPEITYRVSDVMPSGANVLLTAQFKTGKTTMCNYLTRCLADGESFLGRFGVTKPEGRITLFNYEVSRDQYRRWLREAGIDNTLDVAVLNLRGYRMQMRTPRVESFLVEWLISRETRVWVVDPFARAFAGQNENDNSEVGAFLDALDAIKERAGVQELVLVTHTGRAEFDIGSERARGATRLDDWPDVRWMLTKDDNENRYFSAMGRDVNAGEMQLDYNVTTRTYRASGAGGRLQVGKEELSNRLLAAIEETPAMGVRAIHRAIKGVGKARVDEELSRLIVAGRVRVQEGANNTLMHFLAGPSVLRGPAQ